MRRYLVFALIFLAPFFVLAEGFDRDLQFGMQNNSDVIKLQELLTDEGLYSGPISGNFFSLTLKAVKKFQTREGIKPASGYFGLKTRTRANTILAISVSASKDEISIKSIVSPVPVVSTMPVKIENNESNAISSIMDQVVVLQKQLDLLLKKTLTSQVQTVVVPNQTPAVAQIIEELVKQNPIAPSINQPSSASVSTTPIQSSPVISSSPQNISVQVTGDTTTSSSVDGTWITDGSFRVIGPNGVESYGVNGTQSN